MYDIDGIGSEENEEISSKNKQNEGSSMNKVDKKIVKSSKQILMNAGQQSEFDSGMNNCQINQNTSNNSNADTTYCTPVYGQIVSSRENHNQINDIQQKLSNDKPSSSFRKDNQGQWNQGQKTTEGWDDFAKRNLSSIKNEEMKKQRCFKTEKTKVTNGKSYDFFPYFDNKEATPVSEGSKEINEDHSNIVIEPMQKLVLHSTDNNLCDNKASALSSIGS